LQSKVEVEIWLFEQTDMRIRGRIIVSRTTSPPHAPKYRQPPAARR
jgi:hypothetical protein